MRRYPEIAPLLWRADSATPEPQHRQLNARKELYAAAGIRGAAPNEPARLHDAAFVAVAADDQCMVAVVATGLPTSFHGGLAAQILGAGLSAWLWDLRYAPPTDAEITAYLNALEPVVAARIGQQPVGPSADDALRAGRGAQAAVGVLLLNPEAPPRLYLLGPVRGFFYGEQIPAVPLTGDPAAAWTGAAGVAGTPVTGVRSDAAGAALIAPGAPAEWGTDTQALYDEGGFRALAAGLPRAIQGAFAFGWRAGTRQPAPAAVPLVLPLMVAAPVGAGAVPAGRGRGQSASGGGSGDPSARQPAAAGALAVLTGAHPAPGPAAHPSAYAPPGPAAALPASARATFGTQRLLLATGAAIVLLSVVIIFIGVRQLTSGNGAGPKTTALSSAPATPSTTALPGKLCLKGSFCIEGRFLEVWRQYGGKNETDAGLIGPPLENPHADPASGRQIQLFRYFQMEAHPDQPPPFDVQFTALGPLLYSSEVKNTQSTNPACHWFPQTQHNVCDDFYMAWVSPTQNLGLPGKPEQTALALFGYPISDRTIMTDTSSFIIPSISSTDYSVQWFERARLWQATGNPHVEIAPLGEEWFQKRLTPTPLPPTSTPPMVGVTATKVAASATPVATGTLTPTLTVAPTDTPSPAYTATPTDTATPTHTPLPTETPVLASPTPEYISYTLRTGDWLSTIYTKFCYPTWEALCERLTSDGQIADCSSIYAGQVLRIQNFCVLTPHP